jgi:hypothetical protein
VESRLRVTKYRVLIADCSLRKVTAGPDRAPVAAVQRLHRVRRTGLHDRLRERRVHAVGQALQTVAEHEEQAVAELGEHREPELRLLAVPVAGPHSEHVLVAVGSTPIAA